MGSKKMARYQLGIYLWLFSVFTVLCLAGVVAWLSLVPKKPIFGISNPHFHVHRNASIQVTKGSVIFDLQIFNPNKRMEVYYAATRLELYAGGGVVGTNSTPDFYQGYKDTSMLRITIRAGREFWRGVNGGGVDFMIRVESDVKFRIIKWKTKRHRVVYEEQFDKVKINPNGTVSGQDYADLKNVSKAKI